MLLIRIKVQKYINFWNYPQTNKKGGAVFRTPNYKKVQNPSFICLLLLKSNEGAKIQKKRQPPFLNFAVGFD